MRSSPASRRRRPRPAGQVQPGEVGGRHSTAAAAHCQVQLLERGARRSAESAGRRGGPPSAVRASWARWADRAPRRPRSSCCRLGSPGPRHSGAPARACAAGGERAVDAGWPARSGQRVGGGRERCEVSEHVRRRSWRRVPATPSRKANRSRQPARSARARQARLLGDVTQCRRSRAVSAAEPRGELERGLRPRRGHDRGATQPDVLGQREPARARVAPQAARGPAGRRRRQAAAQRLPRSRTRYRRRSQGTRALC